MFLYKNHCITILSLLLICSCSGQGKTVSHKLYSAPPQKQDSVCVVSLQNAFMLTRAKWFAEKLNIREDSVYGKLERFSDSVMFNELSRHFTSSFLSKDLSENFIKETQKIRKGVFIKTRVPPQGIQVACNDGIYHKYLFIIHEFTIGGDLEPMNFYDYSKANVELEQKKKFKNLSIVASYTLWDNYRQIPLTSGIADSQIELLQDSFNAETFSLAIRKVMEQCIRQL